MKIAKAASILILNLPTSLQRQWMDKTLIHKHLKRGGFPGLSEKDIDQAIRLVSTNPLVRVNPFGGSKRYAIRTPKSTSLTR